jgi:hypothetical protein
MILEDEPDRAIAKVGQLPIRQRERFTLPEFVRPRREPFERAEDVEQGALAGAGRPEDGERLAILHGEVDVAQDGQLAGACGVALTQIFEGEAHDGICIQVATIMEFNISTPLASSESPGPFL